MIITTSWDDGDMLDERLADILDRHEFRGTFYIAQTHRARRLSEAGIRMLTARHEIGAHSLTHPDLTRLDRTAKTREVAGSKSWLEDVTGKPVAMFCYPLGVFDRETKQVVAEAGFRGARATGQFSIEPHRDRFAMRTTLQVHPMLLRNSTIGDLGRYLINERAYWGPGAAFRVSGSILKSWSSVADLLLAAAALDDTHVFHLWGHSWEIEEHGMWRQFDAFLSSISQLGYQARTNGEIC